MVEQKMAIKIKLTEIAKKIISERLENSEEKDQIIVITEFERFNWCSTHRAHWTSVHFEDKSRVNELELLGTANGLEVFVDEDSAYFLFMAKKIIIGGEIKEGKGYLLIDDLR